MGTYHEKRRNMDDKMKMETLRKQSHQIYVASETSLKHQPLTVGQAQILPN
jgi:hypothetical protein